MFKPQRLRDPLHDLVEFRGNEFEHTMWKVIQTRPFQRLRRIKQLGFSDFVYPGATHSRFAHSVGVFHIARRLMKIVRQHLGEAGYLETRAHQALAAALVHDLGHGPFSHAFEDVGRRLKIKMADHVHVSNVLIRQGELADTLNILGGGFASDVASMISAAGPGNIYGAVVSSQFDADRLDYMQRDRLMTGSHHSAIDFEWIMANLDVSDVPTGVDDESLGTVETLVIGPKAIYAAEAYVLGLFQLYPTVYFHKATRGAEKMFTELLFRLITLVRDGSTQRTGLKRKHPLMQFANHPDSADGVLTLDDTVVTGALTQMIDAKDSIISEFAMRLRDRKLYKCINVRADIGHQLGAAAASDGGRSLDRACAYVGEKVEERLSTTSGERLPILSDEMKREPYKELQESKGPLNQIMIKTESGELIDLRNRSEIVKAIETFQLYRLYLDENDDESRKFIENCIDEGVGHVKKD